MFLRGNFFLSPDFWFFDFRLYVPDHNSRIRTEDFPDSRGAPDDIPLFFLYGTKYGKAAILYAVNYMYEHRTEADWSALKKSLRAMLSGARKEIF